ncbi:MAG: hypothetical protein RBJ76_12680 [Stenomitos frigidus ULC029]
MHSNSLSGDREITTHHSSAATEKDATGEFLATAAIAIAHSTVSPRTLRMQVAVNAFKKPKN